MITRSVFILSFVCLWITKPAHHCSDQILITSLPFHPGDGHLSPLSITSRFVYARPNCSRKLDCWCQVRNAQPLQANKQQSWQIRLSKHGGQVLALWKPGTWEHIITQTNMAWGRQLMWLGKFLMDEDQHFDSRKILCALAFTFLEMSLHFKY